MYFLEQATDNRRIRKVKCDETKPGCTRCLRSGRECDGYSDPTTEKQTPRSFNFINYVIHGPSFSAALFNHDAPQQRRAFEYYQLRSSLELSGPFDGETDVWNRLVLQVAYHEGAIKHAVCALGSFHQHYSDENEDGTSFLKTGLEEYSLALNALAIAKPSQRSVEVTLVGCILSIFCEQLQGHLGSAKTHVDGGLKLLHAYVRSDKEGKHRSRKPGNRQHYIPLQTLVTLFKRLYCQLIEIGQPSSYVIDQSLLNEWPQTEYQFHSVAAASYALEGLVQRLNLTIQHATTKQLSGGSREMALLRETVYTRLSQLLHQWKTSFDDYLFCESQECLELPKQNKEAVQILRLWYFSASLFLQLDSPNEVMDYDECITIFQAMVDVGHDLLFSQTETQQKQHAYNTKNQRKSPYPVIEAFTFIDLNDEVFEHKGIEDDDFHALRPSYFSRIIGQGKPVFTHTALSPLPPLFLVATRCRDPNLRRQALEVLSQLNRRDGFWDSNMAATCAGLIIYSEELQNTNLNGKTTSSSNSVRIESAKQVRSSTRMVGIRPQFGEGRSLTLNVLKARTAP